MEVELRDEGEGGARRKGGCAAGVSERTSSGASVGGSLLLA